MNSNNGNINNNGEEGIDIETESETLNMAINTQIEDKGATKTEDQNSLDAQKKITDVNPLFYEIGPFPRKPDTVVVEAMDVNEGQPPQEYTNKGDVYRYDPSRNGFVQLVFGLVLVMLLCTIVMSSLGFYIPALRYFFVHQVYSKMIWIFAGALLFMLPYAFICCECTKHFPCNYICLWLATLGYSLLCTYFSIRYEGTVLLAIVATVGVVMICFALSCTNFDFTKLILIIVVALAALLIISLLLCIYSLISGHHIKPLHALIIVAMTVLNSIMLVIELQMVLGGRTVQLSEDDYAYGAFIVYSSIIILFLDLMKLLNIDWTDLF